MKVFFTIIIFIIFNNLLFSQNTNIKLEKKDSLLNNTPNVIKIDNDINTGNNYSAVKIRRNKTNDFKTTIPTATLVDKKRREPENTPNLTLSKKSKPDNNNISIKKVNYEAINTKSKKKKETNK